MLFYEWHKDISQQIWESRKYQFTSYFVPTIIMVGTLQFKRHPSSSFKSNDFITNSNSHQIMNVLKSRLSPV